MTCQACSHFCKVNMDLLSLMQGAWLAEQLQEVRCGLPEEPTVRVYPKTGRSLRFRLTRQTRCFGEVTALHLFLVKVVDDQDQFKEFEIIFFFQLHSYM
jgi:hypothetical protein